MIAPDQWTPADDLNLETGAFAAATSTAGNLLVTAGPGAGKTELLAQRADFLLRTGVCRYPRRILAISFKVDAAKNLKDRVQRRCQPALAARTDSFTFHAFAKRIIDIFRPVLAGDDRLVADYEVVESRPIPHQQIDFRQMAPLATKILRSSRVARTAVASTYAFVFLDEFQDCTPDQYALIRAAFYGAGAQLIAVGDTKQRIMGFAGADEGIFDLYEQEFEARQLMLFQNRRSDPVLRRMQNRMARALQPSAAVPDEDITGDDGVIDVCHYSDEQAEARDVADRIESWLEQGVPGEEIAVLSAIQPHLYTVELQKELRARQIPFRLENEVQDLASEPVCALLADLLCVLYDQNRPIAYSRLMESALGWGVSEADDNQRYLELRKFIAECRRDIARGDMGIADMIDRFRQVVSDHVLVGLSPAYQQGDRMEERITLFVHELDQLIDATGDVVSALGEFLGEGAIRILTVHKAKGLEFDAVVVVAVEHEMYFDKGNAPMTFFVAASRARHALVLTSCDRRTRPAGTRARWNTGRTPYDEFLSYAQA